MSGHLSSFDLAVWFADGKPAGAIAEHVASCDRCADHVHELDALASDRIAHRRDASPRAARALRWLVAPAGAALALAAAVLLVVRSRAPDDDPGYVGTKGTPAVQVLVRSEGVTRVWDGRSPVHPGDALALHVACEGLTQATVAADAPFGVLRLSDGSCPRIPSTLPFTLVVDDQPGPERFSVVLSVSRVDDDRLRELVRQNTRGRDVWTTSFDLPKEPRR